MYLVSPITNRPKENDAKLIKDSINKRQATDDEEDDNEDAYHDQGQNKNEKLLVHRLSNKLHKRSIITTGKQNNHHHHHHHSNQTSLSSPSLQITLPNHKAVVKNAKDTQNNNKIDDEDKNSDDSSTEQVGKKRFVFLFKGGRPNETTKRNISYTAKTVNATTEYTSTDEENNEEKLSDQNNAEKEDGEYDEENSLPKSKIQKDYYYVPTVKSNIVKTKTVNACEPTSSSFTITRTNSTTSSGSPAKKSKRRVHLKQDIASPAFKSSLMSRLSTNTQSQQIVPSTPMFARQKEESQSPIATDIEVKVSEMTKSTERNNSFADDNDFLDISIGEKEQLSAF